MPFPRVWRLPSERIETIRNRRPRVKVGLASPFPGTILFPLVEPHFNPTARPPELGPERLSLLGPVKGNGTLSRN